MEHDGSIVPQGGSGVAAADKWSVLVSHLVGTSKTLHQTDTRTRTVQDRLVIRLHLHGVSPHTFTPGIYKCVAFNAKCHQTGQVQVQAQVQVSAC